MRILMIATTYPRFSGDTAAPFIASIAEGIAALGHAVDMVVPFHPQLVAGVRNGVELHSYHVPGDRRRPLWGYAQSMEADVKVKKSVLLITPFALASTLTAANRLLGRNPYDLIHAHWVLPNGLPAARLARKYRLPLVVSLHGSDMFVVRKNPLFAKVAASIFKQAAMVTACSPDLQELAQVLSSPKVRVLEYGVDIDHFAPDPSVTRKPHSVFSVGRLVHKKGFFHLIEAFSTVRKYYDNSTLTIAGAGPLLDSLKAKCEALGIAGSVIFAGNVERGALPAHYNSSEVVTVPSVTDEAGNRDGLPNVFLEALSCGCAVVASDIPGIANVIGEGQEAVLVPSGDVPALGAAIMELLHDPSRAQHLREAARKKSVAELSWTVRSKQLESLYFSLLSSNGSAIQ